MLDDISTVVLYEYFCTEIINIYLQFLVKYNIMEDSQIKSENIGGNKPHPFRTNEIELTNILRISIENELFSLHLKCLYNEGTKASIINLIDFKIKKLYLRCGGFGSKVINLVYTIHQMQLNQMNVKNVLTKVLVFKFMSVPFQIKNGFSFKYVNNLVDEQEDINFSLELLNQMNKICLIDKDDPYLNKQFIDENSTSILISDQFMNLYNNTYIKNEQMKNNIIPVIVKEKYKNFNNINYDLYISGIYKNFCNNYVTEVLSSKRIIFSMQNLLYLQKIYETGE